VLFYFDLSEDEVLLLARVLRKALKNLL